LILAVMALIAGSCSGADGGAGSGGDSAESALAVEVVSSHPEAVSGGDAVLAVPTMDGPAELTVTLDGEELETRPAPSPAEARDLGPAVLVGGLPEGTSSLRVTAQTDDGDRLSGEVELTNHPKQGPVFSGEQFTMTRCSTEDFGLEASTPPTCDAPTRYAWRYIDTDGGYHDLDDPTTNPDDARIVETADGSERPLIIRDEFGVINRSPYQVSVFDPNPSGDPDGASFDASGWNGRLVYRYGGGCGTSYTQGFSLLGNAEPDLFAKGYATATATFNTFQVMCDDVLSAETTSMVKEHVIETLGAPVVTIGEGGSGGAIQQYLIAQNYPGLLDAIGPTLPFPDAMSISAGVLDCSLLVRYFEGAGGSLDQEQRAAIADQLSADTCGFWDSTFAAGVNPAKCGLDLVPDGGDAELLPGQRGGFITPPKDSIYDAASNPDGVRCTLQDANVAKVGVDPDTGWARRPWDNVGVAYGLSALNDGTITAEQFLDLNDGIGSYDLDGALQDGRSEADVDGLEAMYRGGRLNLGEGDLRRIPIISVNVYTDPQGDIHDRFRVFTVRERLSRDGEAPPNSVIWTRGIPEGDGLVEALTGGISLGTELIELLDEWATAIAEEPDGDREAVVERTRPDEAVDRCWSASGDVLAEGDGANEQPDCANVYPVRGDPRTGAGAPLSDNVMKCRTMSVAEAIDGELFEVELSDEQRTRLEQVFPDGMCDYSQPAVGETAWAGAWQRY
ncbi:MAG: hypothetical protein KDB24_08210, partial [Microthrixaceae bacterium]|nr:hypothetical protein [Microthrixaceae bacterium]